MWIGYFLYLCSIEARRSAGALIRTRRATTPGPLSGSALGVVFSAFVIAVFGVPGAVILLALLLICLDECE
jgi:hypothetical protein